MEARPRVVIAGGGAAGFFAALRLAEACPVTEVVILEQSAKVLSKVAISGGGRCNVTHQCFEPRTLCRQYPRGEKELRGPFHHFQPRDTVDWFDRHGVRLVAEDDGRMFPSTDDSATIVTCLTTAAKRLEVETRLRTGLRRFQAGPEGVGFGLDLTNGETLACDALMIATGGLKEGNLAAALRSAGHRIMPLAPSLFTFHIDDPRLIDLAGIVAETAEVRVEEEQLKQAGPLLITHWGLSGVSVTRRTAEGL